MAKRSVPTRVAERRALLPHNAQFCCKESNKCERSELPQLLVGSNARYAAGWSDLDDHGPSRKARIARVTSTGIASKM
jgi:hypothetical protein